MRNPETEFEYAEEKSDEMEKTGDVPFKGVALSSSSFPSVFLISGGFIAIPYIVIHLASRCVNTC